MSKVNLRLPKTIVRDGWRSDHYWRQAQRGPDRDMSLLADHVSRMVYDEILRSKFVCEPGPPRRHEVPVITHPALNPFR